MSTEVLIVVLVVVLVIGIGAGLRRLGRMGREFQDLQNTLYAREIPPEILSKVQADIAAGRMVDAVKAVRESTGLKLGEALTVVGLIKEGKYPPPEGAQHPTGPSPLSTHPALDAALLARLEELLDQKKPINAIKELRQATGVGLKEAKDYVDALAASRHAAASGATPAPSPLSTHPAVDAALLARLNGLLDQRQKITAIKELREATDVGLKEAKDYVEALERSRHSAASVPAPKSAQESTPAEPTSASRDLAARARELREQGDEVGAIRLVCDETGMGILDAQKFVRSLD